MIKKLLFLLTFCVTSAQAQTEVFYHVFQRSFFDSNGDGNGDLAGIDQKLDYLQELGVNTILLTPLYASDFYHNYFAYDFEKIDPEYGKMVDYVLLVKEVHKRNMKIYQDVEMQYVAGTHPWFKDSFGNPKSKYSKYLMYDDAENKKPWNFWNITDFTLYDGRKEKIIVVNMNEKKVKEYTQKVLDFWVDPNKDGKFDDGVDGFRLDHMMDNLDNANRLTNLFADFWTPLFSKLRAKNPKLKFVAEQANWGSYGHDYFTKGNVDFVFAFRLKFAINKYDKLEIEKAADSTFNYNPFSKNQLVFIENHDTKRFASEPGMTVEKSKAAAAIQLLIGGIPSLYYGQELGMKGEQRQLGMTDGNDIGVRESFEWYKNEEGNGTANWYKNTGPWWDGRFNKSDDGISYEEEKSDPNSLYNFYRSLLNLRKSHRALEKGAYSKISNGNPQVLSFGRSDSGEKIAVFVNLSDKQQATLSTIDSRAVETLAGEKAALENGRVSVVLPAYGFSVVLLR
ncbi:alpha-glucosidase C-terminal domain-containing protein [Flavobacterium sp. MAH-1]|uniref:Alpha-glucosidase C-terminal domain-containing protein n=1 Tax=Flavobacterium agri TaxID=2743471 RepID=A0A7Y8Y1V3_9FLAO|nr:alpha-amylase family glycosyl hydrolase [Flavobacterium agri]NUY81027.1 alpha-glucosidase C-terminal domain-containing protein [Flavobacterium agri]NYA71051.1 alpha-glucosidase C-terminal domain-containing protein [Flavobacterium agri]